MFDIGASELLVIAIIAIIVVGPKDLPRMLRTFGRVVGKMRSMARDFQNQFEQAARESGLDEVRRSVSDVQRYSPSSQVKKAVGSIAEEGDKLKRDIASAGEDKPAKTPQAPAKADDDKADGAGNGTAPVETAAAEKAAEPAAAKSNGKTKTKAKGKAAGPDTDIAASGS